MWYDHCSGPRREHHRRPNWFGDFGFAAFDLGGRPRGARRGSRMFDQGDLKLVILQLLEEKPRHGYDIIKALEEKSGGGYSPSPGTVYPTLSLLEEMDFAKATVEESGKKVYAITDEGRKYLAENRTTVDDVLERLVQFGESLFGGRPMITAHEAMGQLGRAYARIVMRGGATPEQIAKIAEILRRAAAELDAVG